jgi:iron complex outermembrane receptor protein
MRKIKTSASMGIAALCLCSTAFGADAPDAGVNPNAKTGTAAKDSQTIEEVVVTAERRSQSIQKIPLSIQAFTEDTLEKMGILSNMDLQQHVPGLIMSVYQGFGQIFIRGIGQDATNSGLESPVAVYVDGVYQSRPTSIFNFVDVERIEVLKGPQGTLYGRNATGGAINIISKAASHESEGQVDVQFGSFNQKILRASVSGPLSEGAAYWRLSAVYNEDDGYMKNTLLNLDQNRTDARAVRASVELTPSDRLNVVFNVRYNEDNTATVFKSLNPLVAPTYTVFNATWIADPYTVKQNVPADMPTKQTGVDMTVKYDLDWARLTSVTAVKDDRWHIRSRDIDQTEVAFAQFFVNSEGKGFREETRFASQDFTLASNTQGPWQWTTLASFMHQKIDFLQNPILPLIGVNLVSEGLMTNDDMGLGGQLSYALGNGLTLTAGARYSRETKKTDTVFYFNNNVTASQNAETTWTAWTPKLVADYEVNRDLMFYASVTEGFKSGGYNGSTYGPTPWNPEKATNYEAGMKSTWLDGKLRINAAAFEIKYTDLQLLISQNGPSNVPVQVMTNAAKATSKGFELEATAQPTQQFQLSAGLQLLRARFDEYSTIDALNPALGFANQTGKPMTRSPDVTFNLGMQYTWPSVFTDKDVILRADGYHRSRMYFTPFKNELASEDLPFLGNVSLSFEPTGNTGMYGAVFVKNITDRVYHSYINATTAIGYQTVVAPPRTFGIQFGYRY